jgi:hypothetical protein
MIVKSQKIFDINTHNEYLTVNMLDDYLLEITYNLQNNNSEEEKTFSSIVKTIDLKKHYSPMYYFSIFISKDKQKISDPVHINTTKDPDMIFYRSAYDYEDTILNVYMDSSLDEIILISRLPYSGECELFTGRAFDCILEVYPNFKFRYNKRILKRKLLAELDWGESLTSNEAQIDYLTLIIKTILDSDSNLKTEVLKKLEGLDNFFDACNTDNVLMVKPEEKLFFDIKTQKDLVRKQQLKYWEELEKNRNEI